MDPHCTPKRAECEMRRGVGEGLGGGTWPYGPPLHPQRQRRGGEGLKLGGGVGFMGPHCSPPRGQRVKWWGGGGDEVCEMVGEGLGDGLMDPHCTPKRAECEMGGLGGESNGLMEPHCTPKRAQRGEKGGWGFREGFVGGQNGGFKSVLNEGRGLEGHQMRGGALGVPSKGQRGVWRTTNVNGQFQGSPLLYNRSFEGPQTAMGGFKAPLYCTMWGFKGSPNHRAVSRLPFIAEQRFQGTPNRWFQGSPSLYNGGSKRSQSMGGFKAPLRCTIRVSRDPRSP